MDHSRCNDLVPRGVWRAPVLSPQGHAIYFAVDHNHRLLENGWTYVPVGENPFEAEIGLKERLDQEDPMPDEQEEWATAS